MNNNSWFKKENPFQTVIGFGGGATGFGAHSSSASKTYMEDIFSTYVYTGNESARSITNGIDNTKGGLVWTKTRTGDAANHYTADTVRGVNELLRFNQANAQGTTANSITAFNENGFSLGTSTDTNWNTKGYASWNFRKQKGFFDIVTWDGNATAGRTISHSLGSVPGSIWIKSTTDATAWFVYHRGISYDNPWEKYLILNETNAFADATWFMNDTAPTSSVFSVGSSTNVNGLGRSYVAYVFAGGDSPAATATSVYTESTGYLQLDQSTDFNLGTSDFTIETWARPRTGDRSGNNFYVLSMGYPFLLYYMADGSVPNSGKFVYEGSSSNASMNYMVSGNTGANSVEQNQWNHIAVTRSGNTFRFFLNGILKHTSTSSGTFGTNTVHGLQIGRAGPVGTEYFQGQVSNFRYVLGTALYTSSFKVPTEPLSNVTGTKVLCCQGSTTSSATVSPGYDGVANTIGAVNSPSWSVDSPFDDPEGFKFGEDEDQNVIKMGNYIGNGSATGPEINIGWQPQWLIIKRGNVAKNWTMFDDIRGIASDYNDAFLYPNLNDLESATGDQLDLTPNGFKIKVSGDILNGSGDNYVYIAIRKPDGYVGKLPSAGTGVFAMDTGNASTTIPVWDSNFPVDFAINRNPDSVQSWYTSARLMQDYYVLTNDNIAANQDDGAFFDSNVGWAKDGIGTWGSTYQSWMWKQCPKGFDVVTYTGGGSGDTIPHNLNAVPEMMWVKNKTQAQSWAVYHKGLNGGTNPEQYYQMLNSPLGTNTLGTETNRWNDTAPTSTHFTVGGSNNTGNGGDEFIAMLFASANDADGNPISKLGHYTGDNTNDGSKVITLGFQPRFLVIKASNAEEVWVVLDTLRGIQTGANDKILYFDRTDAQVNNTGVDLSATGFALRQASGEFNANGYNYLYYAHA